MNKGQEVIQASTSGGVQGRGVTPPAKPALELFPIEVWGFILDNLEEPRDLASCSNASLLFRKELNPKRTEFLFEQVLPILIKKGSFSHETLFQQLLNMRRVCPAWKTGVNSFLEDHPCHSHLRDFCTRPKNIYTPPSTLFDCFQLSHRYSFSSWFGINRCKTFIEGLSSSSSFFLGRTILFDDSSNTELHSRWFWNGVRDLLGKVGGEIWHCEIRKMRIQVGGRLPSILKLMPNLKTLKVSFQTGGLEMEVDSEDEALLSPPSKQLPALPHLQVLSVKGWQPLLDIVHQLLSSYTHVKRLEFDSIDHLYERSFYPNLESLAVPSISTELEMEQMRRFVVNSTPSVLHVSFVFPDYTKIRGFKGVVNTLQLKPVPLKSLKWELKNINEEFPRLHIQHPFQLPDLKELVIDTGTKLELGFGKLDFLLPLKSLEKLTLIGRTYVSIGAEFSDEDTPFVINFLGMESQLYLSNIWQLFPKLDQVLLKIFNRPGVWKSLYYERAGFQRYCQWVSEVTRRTKYRVVATPHYHQYAALVPE
ncbi:hypothetical protein Ocin01_18098 [Orchesella cincta]|uniref:Uncharacterized protein n=1 Tax=Orchesella cincta TaxID=48709 RepID=A0A1D2M6I2_ORCCI|nr:hypothetical protein Ocin01_18098 [Orchesella cincta]